MTPKKMGFAVMEAGLRRKIASMGGKAVHAKGRAHKWTIETAVAGGRKGGLAPHRNRPVVTK